eukprot:TRINITY_DN74254_c0_g1_i1.p1 TRINITY_DN74254_c0_g1~~TRINITY_DN74254_c0_g1_i1.p1  ORF type:complete len:431 (-),score=68.03 TRINITY_DN74254_c0_g1_i1:53-1345(-)
MDRRVLGASFRWLSNVVPALPLVRPASAGVAFAARSVATAASSSLDPSKAFELEAHHLAAYARRLARQYRGGIGADPVDLDKAWNNVLFQAQGLADQLSAQDACTLLRALASSGTLSRQTEACRVLVDVLRREPNALKPKRVIALWHCLDRADLVAVDGCMGDAGASVESYFREAFADVKPGSVSPLLRISNAEWQRILPLLAASGRSSEHLQPLWRDAETGTLRDVSSVRALSIDGLLAALRALSFVRERVGADPAHELVELIVDRVAAQAQWLDAWSTSHALLALGRLGIAPRRSYDRLRQQLVDSLGTARVESVGKTSRAASLGSRELERLPVVRRVAAGLALLDIHDAELRKNLAPWLLRPLPAPVFLALAEDLARIGLCDEVDPKVARQVRARARSGEFQEAGSYPAAVAAARILEAYAQDREIA